MMSLSPHIDVERTFALAVLSDDAAEIGDTIGRFIVELTT
jgi:hypothetical protein